MLVNDKLTYFCLAILLKFYNSYTIPYHGCRSLPKSATIISCKRKTYLQQTKVFTGFKENDKLNKIAAQYLKESKNDLNIAQSMYFKEKLRSLCDSDMKFETFLQSYDPVALSSKHDSPSLDTQYVHNKLIEITYDTVAEYLPYMTQKSAEDTVSKSMDKKLVSIAKASCVNKYSAILDVGCGSGDMIPYLLKSNGKVENYLGIDISSEMIKLAKQKFPKGNFMQSNFFDYYTNQYDGKNNENQTLYDTILFNGVIQFMPNIADILEKSINLLKPNSTVRIVISHAQGGDFVKEEKRKNPAIVANEMPDVNELENILRQIVSKMTTDKTITHRKMNIFTSQDLFWKETTNLSSFYLVVIEFKTESVNNSSNEKETKTFN